MLTQWMSGLLTVCACAVPSIGAGAGEVPGCRNPLGSESPMPDRQGALAAYESLPPDCLKQIYLACALEANQAMLDFGRAMVCSLGHEALLRQHFKGDFRALMGWWRAHRDSSPESPNRGD